ncbi:SCY kinase (incomplete catalytic triad), putative [Eimeria mitis]|uniref:SCY kinase (Incomplete catalytic triad), putative n=1 Tax=Eimeria mitis TaxID=44415 RepID=U6KDG0_9EIME|nr:SCY kinase (incomplete catalytic triad), putative [Eimeria mitis]CDJ36055.1 SCY kinase (incomplete catalytic triad), putative [Eimeria mitis]
MLQSLWKSISSWGDLPTSFPYSLGSAIPYGFELPGGFVQFSATSTKQSAGAAAEGAGRQHPILDALLNAGNASHVSVFALKRAKQQSSPFKGNGSVSQHTFEQAKNHFAKCKTLLHPNLLKVLATYETSNALYIVTECCFSLVHVVHLSRQQQQQQDLAAKRPPSLPQPHKFDPPRAPVDAVSDSMRKAEAAAVAAAGTAAKTCWNFLELTEGLSFLHDQCKLVHGEVSPFSIFVTPHGKWKLSSFVLTRPLEDVRWPEFYSSMLTSASAAQGWEPPRPSPGSRPDTLDRWGLCSVFAWWQECLRDPYSSARPLRSNRTDAVSYGLAIGINDASFHKAMHKLAPPLQRLMRKILDSSNSAPPLSKLVDGGDPCFTGTRDVCCQFLAFIRAFPVKSHVDKETFFEQQLPAALQQQTIPYGMALHLLLPELALLFMNSSASAYHCSILKCIMSIVTPLSTPSGSLLDRNSCSRDEEAVPLHLLSEVLAHAFDNTDRAIRFALLSQLPAVQSLLPDEFFGRTWSSLTLGLEDSAPPIRAFTSRILSLYVSRFPREAPQTSTAFTLLEQRLRDAAGGVRLEAVVSAAAAAMSLRESGTSGSPPLLVDILSASLRDPEESVRLAGLQASICCADSLPLAGLVTLLAAASACFLSPSGAVVSSTPACIHALTDAAKARAEEQQQPLHQRAEAGERPHQDKDKCKPSDGWLAAMKSLGITLGFSKRQTDSTELILHKNKAGSEHIASLMTMGDNSPTGVRRPCHPAQPPQPPPAPLPSSPLSRSTDDFKDAREPINSWGDDMEIPADAWETIPGFETGKQSLTPSSGSGASGAAALQREDIFNNSAGKMTQRAAAQGEIPRRFTGGQTSAVSRGSNGTMRLQTAAPAPLMAVSGGGGTTSLSANKGPCAPTSASNAEAALSADDFFASVEREAAQRNL